ncbi:Mitochondrial distribution and morphology protein 35 [Polyrhizophydium stewartii]|uniref:Mitochondrial distribution and morphology protein 35 n=1 Tax=Polyrhizophydium stewartii TaxID=2732419 RepID=A0ABR4N7M7_9FUNG|nr:Mitochondrial distribution and morphology protein 35 [Polyrhizophydium stewartii]
MASLTPECAELKQAYDACFNKWYAEKFLKGDRKPACEDIFEKYRACIWKAIKDKKLDKLIEDAQRPPGAAKPANG